MKINTISLVMDSDFEYNNVYDYLEKEGVEVGCAYDDILLIEIQVPDQYASPEKVGTFIELVSKCKPLK